MPLDRFLPVRSLLLCSATLVAAACSQGDSSFSEVPVPDSVRMAAVGKQIFSDQNLSIKRNQSCASCHDASYGFTSPDTSVNSHGGVVGGSLGRFAFRRPPSAAYAAQSPALHYSTDDETYVGGLFWDGHATGQTLGSPAAEQALFPFLGANEMALPDQACVIYRIVSARYALLYRQAFGSAAGHVAYPSTTDAQCEHEGVTIALSAADRATVKEAYNNVGRAIAAFEASAEVSPFASRYDDMLAGHGTLTDQEMRGLALYEGKAGCNGCHPNAGPKAQFTDFTYDNIGVPTNSENPRRVSESFLDAGLGTFLGIADNDGQQKVASLRNLDMRPFPGAPKSYMHNGVFKSIAQVVHFYNTRDVLPACPAGVGSTDARFGVSCWPAPEIDRNVNRDELGNLGMTASEEADLVAFLKTLTDHH